MLKELKNYLGRDMAGLCEWVGSQLVNYSLTRIMSRIDLVQYLFRPHRIW